MKNFNLDAILEAMLKMSERVSDLNFSVGRAPQVEIDGQLVPINFPGLPKLTPYQTEMIAMYMLRSELHLSFPKIAHELGRKDHTTAIHSVDKIEKELNLC